MPAPAEFLKNAPGVGRIYVAKDRLALSSVGAGSLADSFNDAEMSEWSVISTSEPDRVSDVVMAPGCEYAGFAKAPVVPVNHQESLDGIVVGFAWNLGLAPDQRVCTVKIEPNRVLAQTFYSRSKLHGYGQIFYELVKEGLRAKSIGFSPLSEPRRLPSGGYQYDRWELLEYSVVTVPANGNAVTEGSKQFAEKVRKYLDRGRIAGERVGAAVRKFLEPLAARKHPAFLGFTAARPAGGKFTSARRLKHFVRKEECTPGHTAARDGCTPASGGGSGVGNAASASSGDASSAGGNPSVQDRERIGAAAKLVRAVGESGGGYKDAAEKVSEETGLDITADVARWLDSADQLEYAANGKLPDAARPELSWGEAAAVFGYTLTDQDFDEQELAAALAKSRDFPAPVQVYRGLDFEDEDAFASFMDEVTQAQESGEPLWWDKPASTSTSPGGAFSGNVQIQIAATRGLDASYYSTNSNELLLPPDSRLRVVSASVKNGKAKIVLEQVGAGDLAASKRLLPCQARFKSATKAWNPQLPGPNFDVAAEPSRPANVVYDWVSRHVGVEVKNLYENGTFVPAARLGSFLTGLKQQLQGFECNDTRNLSGDGRESPPVYKLVQLNSTQSADFLVSGIAFYTGGQGLKFVLEYARDYRGISVTLYTSARDKQFNAALLNDAWVWAKENNFLKGEAFALSGEFLPRTKEVWADVFLEAENKEALQRTLDLFNAKGKAFANRGVILTGEPGTGKTLSGRILRNDLKGTFIWLSSRDFHYSGGFDGIAEAFGMAKELAPACIFMEDVDNWLSERTIDLVKTEMDGIARSSGVWTILTTNFPERLPEALIDRPGRFHDVLHFAAPTKQVREQMLAKWLPDVPELQRAQVAASTDGYSGAHVYELAAFARSLQEYDGLDASAALAEAVKKVEAQRDLITQIQLEGSRYRPDGRFVLGERGLGRAKGFTSAVKKKMVAVAKTTDDNGAEHDSSTGRFTSGSGGGGASRDDEQEDGQDEWGDDEEGYEGDDDEPTLEDEARDAVESARDAAKDTLELGRLDDLLGKWDTSWHDDFGAMDETEDGEGQVLYRGMDPSLAGAELVLRVTAARDAAAMAEEYLDSLNGDVSGLLDNQEEFDAEFLKAKEQLTSLADAVKTHAEAAHAADKRLAQNLTDEERQQASRALYDSMEAMHSAMYDLGQAAELRGVVATAERGLGPRPPEEKAGRLAKSGPVTHNQATATVRRPFTSARRHA